MNLLKGFMKFGGKISFPLSSEETSFSSKKFLDQAEKILLAERAKSISRHGDIISFAGSFFRFRWTASFLRLIDNGFIRATTEGQCLKVTYRFSFLWMFWDTFPISLIIPIFFSVVEGISFTSAIALFGLIFGMTFGIAIITAFISIFLFIQYTHESIYRTNLIWRILYWFS